MVALDESLAMLTIAHQAAVQAGVHVEFRQHRLDQTLPGESSSVDLVIAALVLCHVANLAQVAHEAYRVVRPGGYLLVTDFHPAAIAAGWRTQFTQADGTYLLPTAQHTRDSYLTALRTAGFHLHTIQDAVVRDAPTDAFPAEVLTTHGDTPFCLVILAVKPAHSEHSI